MTDYATYRALPAQERDELGFARWKELQQIGTHGTGCHAWGPKHYNCAVRENAAKDKQLAAYATLVKSIEERQRLASNEHAKAIEARDSLQSERDANSILTTENAALAAEVERLKVYGLS